MIIMQKENIYCIYFIIMISFKVVKINFKIIILLLLLLPSFLFFYNFSNAQSEDSIAVPIVMYHSILKSKSGDYTIHPETFENDLKYILSKGYTTITMTDLINYVYNDSPLPENPIIITFDDGYYNNLSYAVPLLHKYNMKAVVSIVGQYTDSFSKSNEANANYGYLRWKDINDLITDGCIEFQNHTYNLHSIKNGRKGCKKLSSESLASYTSILKTDISKLQDEFNTNCNGYIPNTFTYPYGAVSKESNSIIKDMGFKASLSCSSGINYITKDKNCLYLLKRFNRVNHISTQKFFSKLLK